ncbi:MAG TPA: hypothetical protein PLL20_10600 [Phycisphaerae bacterium]|nr:hypothetical protein [Phycisphaerae bacterium]
MIQTDQTQASCMADAQSGLPTTDLEKTGTWKKALARTAVYKRVPFSTRRALDRAILARPEGCATLEAIEARFRLTERFGVSRDNLRTYARKLERVAEPCFAGNLAAAILGCMPTAYGSQVAAGSRIILVSRLVQALTQGESRLEIPELIKLASALRLAHATAVARNAAMKGCGGRGKDRGRDRKDSWCFSNQAALAEAVRTVYGLEYPAHRPTGAETPGSPKPEIARQPTRRYDEKPTD